VFLVWPFSSGSADVSNRNLLPIGEREAFLANTGITSPTGGAVFYNPANLARLPHPTISMSGTTLLRFGQRSKGGFDNQPVENSGFVIIPASLVSTYRFGDWSFASAVMVPDNLEVENRSSYALESASVATFLIKNNRRDFWLGLSGARRINDRLSVGLSLFGVRRSASSLVFFKFAGPQTAEPGAVAPEQMAAQLLGNTSTSVLGITAIAGAHYEITPWLGVGVRAQSPLWQISGRGDIYVSTVASKVMMGNSPVFELDQRGVKIDDPLPTDIGMGVSVFPHERIELMADLNLQMPMSFRTSSFAPEDRKLVLTARYSMGAEAALGDSIRVQIGALYNPSAVPIANSQSSREDFVGGTVGIRWKAGRTCTGLGGFFFASHGENAPVQVAAQAPPEQPPSAEMSSRLYGALLTVAYEL
jgi:long-subunit fatty acid transport protein